MLHQGRIYILLILLQLLIISCNEKKDVIVNDIKLFQNHQRTNDKVYKELYKSVNDSLHVWIKDSLSITKFIFCDEWQLSTIFIFNKDSTRIFTTIIDSRSKMKNDPSDNIYDFGGAKINGRWYFFFMGVSEPIDRVYWQDSVYAPLTFEELNYVAYELRLKTLIKNIDDGYPEKNEDIFKNKLFPELPGCKGLKGNNRKLCEDSMILKSVKGKYQYKIDAKIIAEINKTMKESVRPPEPVKSWKDKIFAKEKFFESKAWKKRTPMD